MGYILQFLAGVITGASWALLFAINSNNSVATTVELQQKLVEICLSANSVPKEYDFGGELVCENGATFNYEKY